MASRAHKGRGRIEHGASRSAEDEPLYSPSNSAVERWRSANEVSAAVATTSATSYMALFTGTAS